MKLSGDVPVVTGIGALQLLSRFARDPVGTGRAYHARYGKTVIVQPPLSTRPEGRKYYVTARPEIAEKIFNSPSQYKTVGVALTRGPKNSSQRRLRNGIVRMNGPQQQALRRAYAPPLSKVCLKEQQHKLTEVCAAHLALWPRARTFDASELSTKVAIDAAAYILFGSNEDPRAIEIADLMVQHSRMQYSLNTFLFPVNLPGTPYQALLKHAALTEKALVDWLSGQDEARQNLVSCIAHMRDTSGDPIDRFGRAAQLWTLYGASFDTTATTLRWTLLHLAWNNLVQDRLLEDLETHGLDSPYLDAVILESLRMTPPVAYQMRRLSAAMDFEGQSLNRGDHVVVSAAAINRDADVYPHPHQFRPERWLDTQPSPMQPLAFSAGPRRCLGFNFAMMVLRTCLSELLATTRVGVAGAPKIGVRLAITQGPNRVPIILTPKDRSSDRAKFTGKASGQMSE